MIDPVISDEAQHQADMERIDAYEAEVERIEMTLEPADVIDDMSVVDRSRLSTLLGSLCHGTPVSQEMAIRDIRKMMAAATTAMAKRQLKSEMDEATKENSMARYYRSVSRIAA